MPTAQLLDAIRDDDHLLGRYQVTFMLSPPLLAPIGANLPTLDWHSIPYGAAQVSRVPNDKRGVYALVIGTDPASVPPHGYVCYIGISGHNSNRSLRSRYRDYLNERIYAKRKHIAHLIVKWHEVLQFCFAPVDSDVTSDQLSLIEKSLNDAFMPPFSRRDFSAEIAATRRAFRG